MNKWKLYWDVGDTLEAETEEEAITAFKELIREGFYGPLDWHITVEEVKE